MYGSEKVKFQDDNSVFSVCFMLFVEKTSVFSAFITTFLSL